MNTVVNLAPLFAAIERDPRTQVEISRQAGLGVNYIAMLKQGVRGKTTLRALLALCNHLNLDVRELFVDNSVDIADMKPGERVVTTREVTDTFGHVIPAGTELRVDKVSWTVLDRDVTLFAEGEIYEFEVGDRALTNAFERARTNTGEAL